MRLSDLQKFALVQCYQIRGNRMPRAVLDRYYRSAKRSPKASTLQGIITRSLERLIDKELLVGYGRRTPHKWFIKEIRLTPKGRRHARALLGRQQRLPLTRKP